MIESLHIGASGLYAQQAQINLISNNVSNLNTPGFKTTRATFSDLVQRQMDPRTGHVTAMARNGLVGYGTEITGTETAFSQGDLRQTERSLDVAIQGKGFLEVVMPDGGYAYSRAGRMQLDADGYLVTDGGLRLNTFLQVPTDATDVAIRPDGEIYALMDSEANPMYLGQLELVGFNNPDGLEALGEKLYGVTDRSGDAFFGTPGEQGMGRLVQGALEASNVDLVGELTDLMLAQRAYQVNARLVQTSDQLLSVINELRT